ncbi:hypothetical protein B0H17DRAFT_1177362 [Mycena rosella]|uniref:Uncharacterized protein n=1 Tax=Mycena rosella TaxID=1033263 RepID=A0AAD7GPB4_MYCRO|nr:hypothetical protein B0H17DRAFT_1177362 [Mycena rosella]
MHAYSREMETTMKTVVHGAQLARGYKNNAYLHVQACTVRSRGDATQARANEVVPPTHARSPLSVERSGQGTGQGTGRVDANSGGGGGGGGAFALAPGTIMMRVDSSGEKEEERRNRRGCDCPSRISATQVPHPSAPNPHVSISATTPPAPDILSRSPDALSAKMPGQHKRDKRVQVTGVLRSVRVRVVEAEGGNTSTM